MLACVSTHSVSSAVLIDCRSCLQVSEEAPEMGDMFTALDADQDGLLSYAEVLSYFSTVRAEVALTCCQFAASC